MKAWKIVSGLVAMFVVMPIWYYLLYQILVRVQASELMWFLYWIYFPVGIFMGVLTKIIETQK